MKKFFRLLAWPAGLLLAMAAGCGTDSETAQVARDGYRPIYISKEAAAQIVALPAQPMRRTGKIYTKDTLVFVNELGKGIHVINNKNPRSPQPIAFIQVPGNVDIAVKGNVLYADNFKDLVVLDITNPRTITELKRLPNALPQGLQPYPPYLNVFFECVDPAKGVVAGWEPAKLTNPKCRR